MKLLQQESLGSLKLNYDGLEYKNFFVKVLRRWINLKQFLGYLNKILKSVLIFILNLSFPITWMRDQEIFNISLFFNSSDLEIESKKFFFAVFGWYFAPDPDPCNPLIFADPDSGSQSLANPTDLALLLLTTTFYIIFIDAI